MTTSPATRRANRLLLTGLIVFSISLALLVLFWMRIRIRANGGIVDPHLSMQLESTRRFVLDRSLARFNLTA